MEGVKFRRQQPLGSYIVDFVSFERKVVVEVDGGQHNEGEARKRDEQRAEWLKEKGYQVLRFWNNEVLVNMEGVLERIRGGVFKIGLRPLTLPHPGPLHQVEREALYSLPSAGES